MSYPPPLTFSEFVDTTDSEQLWQIYNAIVENGGGGGGGVTDPNVAVESDGVTRAPLNLDSDGRLIVDFPDTQSVSGTVAVSNFPATQPVSGSVSVSNLPSSQAVTNAGTFAVQNTAAIVGGNSTAVKVDGSAVTQPVSGTVGISGTVPVTGTFYQATQPVSAASLPLPTGAATSANQTNGTAKTQQVDASGNIVGTLPLSGITAASQALSGIYVQESTANTSNTQLAAGATFTGTIETVYNQPAVSVLVYSDQPGTLTLNLYQDAAGTKKVFSKTYSYTALAQFQVTQITNGNYFNLTFQNTGGSATTALVVDTAFGCLPFNTQLGNQPVAINEVGSGVTLPVSGTFWQTTQPVSGTVAVSSIPSLPAGTNSIGSVTGTISDFGYVVSPSTTTTISTTGTVGPVSLQPGMSYLVSVGKIYTAATLSFTASGGAAGQTTITTGTTPAGIAIGQQVVGTGIPKGAVVVSFVANTSVTISLPLTATASGTVYLTSDQVAFTFQTNSGSGFTNTNAILLSSPSLQTPSATQYYSGMYLIQAPVGTSATTLLELSVGTLTNATLNWSISPVSAGASVSLPYNIPFSYTQANWPSGACFVPIIDREWLREIAIDVPIFLGTSQTISFYQTNDPLAQAPQSMVAEVTITGSTMPTWGVSTNSAGFYRLKPVGRYILITQTGTALTGWSVGGVSALVAIAPESSSSVNLSAIGGLGALSPTPNGSSSHAVAAVLGTATKNTDASSVAFAGSGRVNGSNVASSSGAGVSISADINVTALTLGTATSVIPILSESYDGGTTFNDIWVGTPITATVHQRMPALPVNGIRRWSMFSVGGTSTTVTVTITATEMPVQGIYHRQIVDVYAATNPSATIINGNTYTSTLVSTTVSSTSSVAIIEGCGALSIGGVFTGGTPTTAPVYTLQISDDLVNWETTTLTVSPTAAGYFKSTSTSIRAKYGRLIVTTASSGGTAYGVTYTLIQGFQN